MLVSNTIAQATSDTQTEHIQKHMHAQTYMHTCAHTYIQIYNYAHTCRLHASEHVCIPLHTFMPA